MGPGTPPPPKTSGAHRLATATRTGGPGRCPRRHGPAKNASAGWVAPALKCAGRLCYVRIADNQERNVRDWTPLIMRPSLSS